MNPDLIAACFGDRKQKHKSKRDHVFWMCGGVPNGCCSNFWQLPSSICVYCISYTPIIRRGHSFYGPFLSPSHAVAVETLPPAAVQNGDCIGNPTCAEHLRSPQRRKKSKTCPALLRLQLQLSIHFFQFLVDVIFHLRQNGVRQLRLSPHRHCRGRPRGPQHRGGRPRGPRRRAELLELRQLRAEGGVLQVRLRGGKDQISQGGHGVNVVWLQIVGVKALNIFGNLWSLRMHKIKVV